MSDKHPEIECYECGRLKTRLIWNSRCVTCTVQRLEFNLEENDTLRSQLAALKEDNERLKARVAGLAAPAVQGEPVAVLLIDEPERTERGLELGDWDIAPNATAIEAFARLAGPGAYQLYLAPQPAEQKPATDVAGPTKVRYIDGLGAVRNSPADCREGVSYVTVADTVYWPLRADDAQRLLSAEFGRGDFTGPGTSTDVSALVKALERIASMDSMPYHSLDSAKITARAALAAHRKQGVRHEP